MSGPERVHAERVRAAPVGLLPRERRPGPSPPGPGGVGPRRMGWRPGEPGGVREEKEAPTIRSGYALSAVPAPAAPSRVTTSSDHRTPTAAVAIFYSALDTCRLFRFRRLLATPDRSMVHVHQASETDEATVRSPAKVSLRDFSCWFRRASASENASSSLTMCRQSHSIISGQFSASKPSKGCE